MVADNNVISDVFDQNAVTSVISINCIAQTHFRVFFYLTFSSQHLRNNSFFSPLEVSGRLRSTYNLLHSGLRHFYFYSAFSLFGLLPLGLGLFFKKSFRSLDWSTALEKMFERELEIFRQAISFHCTSITSVYSSLSNLLKSIFSFLVRTTLLIFVHSRKTLHETRKLWTSLLINLTDWSSPLNRPSVILVPRTFRTSIHKVIEEPAVPPHTFNYLTKDKTTLIRSDKSWCAKFDTLLKHLSTIFRIACSTVVASSILHIFTNPIAFYCRFLSEWKRSLSSFQAHANRWCPSISRCRQNTLRWTWQALLWLVQMELVALQNWLHRSSKPSLRDDRLRLAALCSS